MTSLKKFTAKVKTPMSGKTPGKNCMKMAIAQRVHMLSTRLLAMSIQNVKSLYSFERPKKKNQLTAASFSIS